MGCFPVMKLMLRDTQTHTLHTCMVRLFGCKGFSYDESSLSRLLG